MIGLILFISCIILATVFSIISNQYKKAYQAKEQYEYSGSSSIKLLKKKSEICSNINTVFLGLILLIVFMYVMIVIIYAAKTSKIDGKEYSRTMNTKSINLEPIILSHEDYTEYVYEYEEYVDNGYRTKYLDVEECIICPITDGSKPRIEVYKYKIKYPFENIFNYDLMKNLSPSYVYEIYIAE